MYQSYNFPMNTSLIYTFEKFHKWSLVVVVQIGMSLHYNYPCMPDVCMAPVMCYSNILKTSLKVLCLRTSYI